MEEEVEVHYPCPLIDAIPVMTCLYGHNSEIQNKPVVIHFKESKILIGDKLIPRCHIRYASTGFPAPSVVEGNVVVLSYREGTFPTKLALVKFIYIKTSEDSMTRMLIDKFKQYSMEISGAIYPRAQSTSLLVDYLLPKFTGTLNVDVYSRDDDVKSDKSGEFTVLLDEECVCLFKNCGQMEPDFQIHFWKEDDKNVVEQMAVVHSKCELVIKTSELVFVIDSKQPSAEEFITKAKRIQPKPQNIFFDRIAMLDYVKDPVGKFYDNSNTKPSSKSDKSDLQRWKEENPPGKSNMDKAVDASTQLFLREFKDKLEEAYAKGERNNDWQDLWQPNDEIIRNLLDANLIPEKDARSGGLDPRNIDHFQKCMEDIDDKLFSQDFEGAIASVRAAREVFGRDSYSELRPIFHDDDYTLLKKLFFKILKDQAME